MADTKIINGVKTIDYRGKSYVEVAERLRHVHEQKREFQVLDSEVYEIAGRVLCRVTISVDGKIFKGTAEAKVTNAAPRSADATNPFECGETSALGRALAFAGFGTVDGIASYDEIARGLSQEEIAQSATPDNARSNGGVAPTPAQKQQAQRPAPVPPQTPAQTETNKEPTPLNAVPSPDQIKAEIETGKYLDNNGRKLTWPNFLGLAFAQQIAKREVTVQQLINAGSEIPYDACKLMAAKLATLKRAA